VRIFENKFDEVVEKFFEFVLCLFGFVKVTEFRDSSEYSDHAFKMFEQRVAQLPRQILYVKHKKFFLRARESLGTSLVLRSTCK